MSDLTRLHQRLLQVVLVGRDLSDVLSEIVGIARTTMPSVDAASITLIRDDKPYTAAYDGQLAMDADELQYERGYGPCMDAAQTGRVLVIDDMAIEDRWPDYAPHAAAHGVGSSLSVPLPFQSTTIGALNTYAAKPHAFNHDERAQGEEVASWVALAIGNATAAAQTSEELANLKIAMQTRAVIEQAKGILMERYNLDQDRAIAVLTRASQNSNTKLRDVASELVTTGALVGIPRPADL